MGRRLADLLPRLGDRRGPGQLTLRELQVRQCLVDEAEFRRELISLPKLLGMAELSDGSILATSTDGPGFFTSNARLLRFVDANKDGFADGPPTVLFNGLIGGITSVQIGGQLVFVTGQNRPIAVLRMGATPGEPFTLVGRIDITYPAGGWLHPHSG